LIDKLESNEDPILVKKVGTLVAPPAGVNDSNIVEAYHVVYVLNENSIYVVIRGSTGNESDAEKKNRIAHEFRNIQVTSQS
jgi:hypothetical protein